jgi:hypothetical protein
MRFLTLEAYHSWYGHYDDYAGLRVALERYARHLSKMESVLPAEVLALARLNGVDDGLIVRVEKYEPSGEIRLTMRCGDNVMGYYDLVLTYEGASIAPEHDQVLTIVARSTKGHRQFKSDLFYHEIDRSDDGRIEHRLLFHPGVWFAIRCESLRWEQVPRAGRRLPPYRNRYIGGPPAK